MTSMFVFAGVLLVIGLGAALIYNRLVALRQRFLDAFSQIDVQLRRRYDLIPNLVETAKGYLEHERETLTAVTEARNAASEAARTASSAPDASSLAALAGAEGVLAGALTKLLAVVESYPDLKASENMQQLSEELASTENRVAFSRQAYNDSVRAYNTYRQSFPPMIFAGTFGFENASYLEFEGTTFREAPKVSFTN